MQDKKSDCKEIARFGFAVPGKTFKPYPAGCRTEENRPMHFGAILCSEFYLPAMQLQAGGFLKTFSRCSSALL